MNEIRFPGQIQLPVIVPKGAEIEKTLPIKLPEPLYIPWKWIGLIMLAILMIPDSTPIRRLRSSNLGAIPRKSPGRRLYYMWTAPGKWKSEAVSIPKTMLEEYQEKAMTTPGILYYVWATSADEARRLLETDYRVRLQSYKKAKNSDFSGAIMNCEAWLRNPLTGRVGCFIYAPSCEGQRVCTTSGDPGKMKVCVNFKKVPSLFYGKMVSRCSKYAPSCSSLTCLAAPAPKPKELEPEIKESEVRSLARALAEQHNVMQAEAGPVIAREILQRGGIAPYRGGYLKEEYKEIPLFLRDKKGLPLDEMASEMGVDEAALVDMIRKAYPKGRKTVRRLSWRDFEAEARDMLREEYARGISGLETQQFRKMKCSWCGRCYDKETRLYVKCTKDVVSHGICQECYEAEMRKLKAEKPLGDLFPGLKRELVLQVQDPARSLDPLDICLERRGWDIRRVRELQADIADRMTPDLFTGKTKPLTGGQIQLQDQIQQCLDEISGKRLRIEKPVQRDLFGQVQPGIPITMRAPHYSDPIPEPLQSLALFARMYDPKVYDPDTVVNTIRERYREMHRTIPLPEHIKGKYPKPLENILAYQYGYASGDPKRSIKAFWYHTHGYSPNSGPLPEVFLYPKPQETGAYV